MSAALKPQFLPNDVYLISNLQYPSFYANLIDGTKHAAVAGTNLNTGNDRKWRVDNFNNNQENKVTIENVAASGYYANVTDKVNAAPVFASTQTQWVVSYASSSAGTDYYYIRSLDGEYGWVLENGINDFAILLRPVKRASGNNAQWKFTKTT